MSGQSLEIILSRQLADCLFVPMFIIDPKGNLLFFNEPAEDILGKHFEETGVMPLEEWATIFKPIDEQGYPLNPDGLPLVYTLVTQKPAHGSFWIESLRGQKFHISVTSYPIIGRSGHFQGAVAIFWKLETV